MAFTSSTSLNANVRSKKPDPRFARGICLVEDKSHHEYGIPTEVMRAVRTGWILRTSARLNVFLGQTEQRDHFPLVTKLHRVGRLEPARVRVDNAARRAALHD